MSIELADRALTHDELWARQNVAIKRNSLDFI